MTTAKALCVSLVMCLVAMGGVAWAESPNCVDDQGGFGGLAGELQDIAETDDGALYAVDGLKAHVYRQAPDGLFYNIAGSDRGHADGALDEARFMGPYGLASGGDRLYIVDTRGHRLRILLDEQIYTVAGDGKRGFKDGPGPTARFAHPVDAVVLPGGTILVADKLNHAIRRVVVGSNDPTSGVVQTLAGDGVAGATDGPLDEARFNWPVGVAVGPDDSIYVADQGNRSIRRIWPDGVVTTWAGGDYGYASGSKQVARFGYLGRIASGDDAWLFVTDRIIPGVISIDPDGLATPLTAPGLGAGTGNADGSHYRFPEGITVTAAGEVLVADIGNSSVKILATCGGGGIEASACVGPVCNDAFDYVYGCTDTSATNHNPDAELDDGTCTYACDPGCQNGGVCHPRGHCVCDDTGFHGPACDKPNIASCPWAPGPSYEVCDGVDNDCNGEIDDALGEVSCGIGGCAHSVTACKNGIEQDCDPFALKSDEVCDGVDNDCDGQTDEGQASAAYCGKGVCKKLVESCVNGVPSNCDPFEGATDEVCNGLDDNCDGQVDEGFGETLCGTGVCVHVQANCVEGVAIDCDPQRGAYSETCDGLDNDCDGVTDEGMNQVSCGLGVCAKTVNTCVDGVPKSCNALDGASAEVCDGLDNNCNGVVDDGLAAVACGVGACAHMVASCVDGQPQVCDPLLGATPEICGDGIDNDCDGLLDNLGIGGCTAEAGKPTNLLVTRTGPGVAKLTWDAPAGSVDRYRVLVSLDPWVDNDGLTRWYAFADGNDTDTVATITGLTDGKYYGFAVMAVTDAAGVGGSATLWTPLFTASTVAPTAPRNLQVIRLDTGKVYLSWSAPSYDGGSQILDYVIGYRKWGQTGFTIADDGMSRDRFVTLDGLTDGAYYQFGVYARNWRPGGNVGIGEVAYENFAVLSPNGTLPGPVQGLTATRTGAGQIRVDWAAPASDGDMGLLGYSIGIWPWGSSTVLASKTPTESDDLGTTTHTFSGLAEPQKYRVGVYPVNPGGKGMIRYADLSLIAPNSTATVPGAPKLDWMSTWTSDGEPSTTWQIVASWNPSVGQGCGAGELCARPHKDLYDTAYPKTWEHPADSTCVSPQPTPRGYVEHAQPILANKCGSCHTGDSKGGYNIGSVFADSDRDSLACAGLSHAECALVKIQNGSMPAGAGCGGVVSDGAGNAGNCVTQSEFAILQAWVDGGTEEKACSLCDETGLACVNGQCVANGNCGDGGAPIIDYHVAYRNKADGQWHLYEDGVGANPWAYLEGLPTGYRYELKIAAENAVGVSEYSNTFWITLYEDRDCSRDEDDAKHPSQSGQGSCPTLPSEVRNLTATRTGSGEVRLSWDPPSDNGGTPIVDYVVYWVGHPWEWIDKRVHEGWSTSTSIKLTGLSDNQRYYFIVYAHNSEGLGTVDCGEGKACTNLLLDTGNMTWSDHVRNLTATPTGQGEITLNWDYPHNDGNSELTHYWKYYVREAQPGACFEGANFFPWDTTWCYMEEPKWDSVMSRTYSGLVHGESYRFMVRATNQHGTQGSPSWSEYFGPITFYDADPNSASALQAKAAQTARVNLDDARIKAEVAQVAAVQTDANAASDAFAKQYDSVPPTPETPGSFTPFVVDSWDAVGPKATPTPPAANPPESVPSGLETITGQTLSASEDVELNNVLRTIGPIALPAPPAAPVDPTWVDDLDFTKLLGVSTGPAAQDDLTQVTCQDAPDGTACDDSNACTTGDHCVGGVCAAGQTETCDDGNECTYDSCDWFSGCKHEALGTACDDGNICTTGDWCVDGVCTADAVNDCSDGNPCTKSTCDPVSGCGVPTADPSANGMTCSGGVCDNGACVPCASGQSQACNPSCGSFDEESSGYRTCVNGSWDTCKPATCTPDNPTYYQGVPLDNEWHCNLWKYPAWSTFYLCLRALPPDSCGSATIDLQMKKGANINGTEPDFGPFDNNIGVSLRNVQTGQTMGQVTFYCQGEITCNASVSVHDWINTLGLSGTNTYEGTVYSPVGSTHVGETGLMGMQRCF